MPMQYSAGFVLLNEKYVNKIPLTITSGPLMGDAALVTMGSYFHLSFPY